MSNRTCSIDGCEGSHKGHGYCLKHYQRFKKTGDPLRNPSGTTQARYSPESRCSVAECESRPSKRGLCGKHYQRLMNHGSTATVLHRTGCRVDSCEGKHFGHGYCSKHRYRFVATGDPETLPSGRTPSGTYADCVVDGCDRGIRGGGGMCNLHAGNFRATGDPLLTPGPRVRSRLCAKCGAIMDFTKLRKGRQRRTSSMRVCKGCRRDGNLPRFVPALIERDGPDCSICGTLVDLELSWPHPMSRSVDHVIPRSRGGEDDIANYALAHVSCNNRKHAKVPAA